MEPSNNFEIRLNAHRQWQPPRPRRSNKLVDRHTTGNWYEFKNGRTTQVEKPARARLEHFKTFSFYFSDGNIWIYPCDATRYQVGDGLGSRRIAGSPTPNEETDVSSSDYETDNDNDRRMEDWRPLSFKCPIPGDNSFCSYATIRAQEETLRLQRPDQASLSQLLPDRYHAAPEARRAPQGYGGLVGELPILVALIAYSVRPDRVDGALTHCLRQGYNSHHRPRGEGCKFHEERQTVQY